jgi:putative DNA primase/helicase
LAPLRRDERPVDGVLRRLRELDCDYSRVAPEGVWKSQCPAHEDRTASLSIREGDAGRVLLHCFTGCPTLDVLQAMGLQWPDLFPHNPERGYVKVCPSCKRPMPS